MATKKTIDLKNLIKLDWKTLVKSKTFWLGIFLAIYGIYNGQLELVIGAGAIVTLRDAVAK